MKKITVIYSKLINEMNYYFSKYEITDFWNKWNIDILSKT